MGLASNALCYVVFLALLWSGLASLIAAMTIAYLLGMILSYRYNKTFTFEHDGGYVASVTKFVLLYGSGYWINLWLLDYLVVSLDWIAAIAQLMVIGVLAVYFFIVQRSIVFAR